MNEVIFTGSIPQCPYCKVPTKRTFNSGMAVHNFSKNYYDESGTYIKIDNVKHFEKWNCLNCNKEYSTLRYSGKSTYDDYDESNLTKQMGR